MSKIANNQFIIISVIFFDAANVASSEISRKGLQWYFFIGTIVAVICAARDFSCAVICSGDSRNRAFRIIGDEDFKCGNRYVPCCLRGICLLAPQVMSYVNLPVSFAGFLEYSATYRGRG